MTNDDASLDVAMAALQVLLCCVANPYEAIACTRQDGDAFHVWVAPVKRDLVGTSLFVRRLIPRAGLYLQTFARYRESEIASSKLLRTEVRCLESVLVYRMYHVQNYEPVNAIKETNKANGVYRTGESLAELLHVPEAFVLLFLLLVRAFCSHLPARERLPCETQHLLVSSAQ